ncbi:MAG: alpha/beta hydrolase, partial [Acidimicrobiales bacterium]
HMAEFFGLLDGGLRDAQWDGLARPTAQLAVLPGLTHYDISQSPQLAIVLRDFFA